jgi:HlyD family secretion protein
MEKFLSRSFRKKLLTQNRVLTAIVLSTGLVLAAGALVLWPAYVNPESRFYTSMIGFLKVQRLLGTTMEAEAQHPVWHDFAIPILGDGTLQCDFYNVPLVATARLKTLLVEEGDKVEEGQPMALLDDTVAQINLRAAQFSLASAQAERQRVNVGTPIEMAAERPEKTRVSMSGLEQVLKQAKTKVAMYRSLQASGASSRLELANSEMDLANAQLLFDEARVDAEMSNSGMPKSKAMAEDAVVSAQTLVAQRQLELDYCTVKAPATGIIDRVLIRKGEYNQSSGNPGFIIASGLWFEANLDQHALGDLHEGMEATVNLEAYAGRTFHATVERIISIVTFNTGGPETKTPVRPLGTGTPEWPATFVVRLHLDDPGVKLAPGMTGFARVVAYHRMALAVPREALSSLSAGKGVIRTVNDSGHPLTTTVNLGEVDDRYAEVTSGLGPSDWVISNNHRFLRDDDKIHITRVVAAEN